MVDYFLPAVDEVVGPFMAAAGFARSVADRVGVAWDNGTTSIRFSYYPEDMPNYHVNVAVAAQAGEGPRQWVGLWKLIPESDSATAYTTLSFHDETELRNLLATIISNALEPGPALWADQSRLATLIAEGDVEVHQKFLADELEAQLAGARWSFDNDRFAEARDRFVLAGEDRLSAADRRRLHVARSNVPADDVD